MSDAWAAGPGSLGGRWPNTSSEVEDVEGGACVSCV